MKKLISLLLVVAMLCTVIVGCGAPKAEAPEKAPEQAPAENNQNEAAPAAEKQTIKVGVSSPITSSDAESAENMVGGIKAAIDYATDQGMLDDWNIELIVEDDAGDPTTGMNAVNKLIYTDGIHALLGPVQSTVAAVTLPVLEEEGIPSIMAVASPALAEQGYQYFFRANGTNRENVGTVLKYFVEEKGFKKIGLITAQNETCEVAMAIAEEALKEYGVEYVVQYFAESDTDYSAQIIAMREAGVEAIFEFTMIVAGAQMTEQIRQLIGPDVYVAGLSNGQTSFLELIGNDAANNSFYATGYDPCLEGELYDTFRTYYAKHVDREAVDVSGRGYDAMMILINALDSLEGVSVDDENFGEVLRDAIRAVEYTGVQGEFKYNEVGDGLTAVNLIEYVDGTRVQVG